MYKDLIKYKLAEWITQEHLLTVAKEVHDSWMSKQDGFIKWEIHTDADGEFTDIVYRASKEAAAASNEDMANLPNADKRYACYNMETITSSWITLQWSFGS